MYVGSKRLNTRVRMQQTFQMLKNDKTKRMGQYHPHCFEKASQVNKLCLLTTVVIVQFTFRHLKVFVNNKLEYLHTDTFYR